MLSTSSTEASATPGAICGRTGKQVETDGHTVRGKGAPNVASAKPAAQTHTAHNRAAASPHGSKAEGDEEKEDHDTDSFPVPRPQLELTVLQGRHGGGGVTEGLPFPPFSPQEQHRLTSASRASSRRRRAAFSLRSCWLSASTACSLASSPCRYSFFFRRDWQADSLFLIIRCCRFSSFAWHQRGQRGVKSPHPQYQGPIAQSTNGYSPAVLTYNLLPHSPRSSDGGQGRL